MAKTNNNAKNAGKTTAWDKVKDFIKTGREYQVKAIENMTDYYAERAMNKPAPKPVTLGSMSPTGDADMDNYLRGINAKADRAGDNSRIDVSFSNNGTGKWIKAGPLENGWQFGDGAKAYIATIADGWRQTKAGMYGLGEKAADTVLMVSPQLYSGLEPAEERSVYPVYSFNPEKKERDKQLYGEWVAEDLYDEETMAKTIYADRLMEKLGIDVERDSLLGKKAKDFSYRAGQEAAVYALGVAGIPTWVTRGVNAFAEEAEHALRSGATYDEALTSALIHAGAEVIVSIVSNNLKHLKVKDKTIGERAKAFADKVFTKNEAVDMSADFMEMMRAHGVDFLKEGTESAIIWGLGKFAESITYQDDKTFIELVSSKEAKREAMKEFVQGYLFSFSENE